MNKPNRPHGGMSTYEIVFERCLHYKGPQFDRAENVPTSEISEARNIFNQAIIVDLCCGYRDLVEGVTLPFLNRNSTGFYYIGADIGLNKSQKGNISKGNNYNILRADCTDYDMIQREIDDARRKFESSKLVFLMNAIDTFLPGYDVCNKLAENIKGWAKPESDSIRTYITGFNNYPEYVLRQKGSVEMMYSFNPISTNEDLYTYGETVISKITL